jgi:hypothetical protein
MEFLKSRKVKKLSIFKEIDSKNFLVLIIEVVKIINL